MQAEDIASGSIPNKRLFVDGGGDSQVERTGQKLSGIALGGKLTRKGSGALEAMRG